MVLWIAAATSTAAGALLLYLGPAVLPAGKGFVPNPLLGQVPLAPIGAGIVGLVVGAAGIGRSRWSAAPATGGAGSRGADAVALAGVIVGAAALAALVLIQFVWPAISRNLLGPCDSNPSVACFQAHPDFSQEDPPGSLHFKTPMLRFYDSVAGPSFLAAWPAGLAAAITCVVALAAGTRHRRTAILGVIAGSLTVASVGTLYLAFLLGGGD
jgi:hypothetical protein